MRCLGYVLLISLVSLSPAGLPRGVPSFPHEDKFVHFIMYGLLAIFVLQALMPITGNRSAALIWAIIACTGYGTLLEVLQAVLLPGIRFFSVGDIVANSAGAACFGWLMFTHNTRNEK